MTVRTIREQLGALLAGIYVRVTSVRKPSLLEAAVLLLFLIILGLAGAADQVHP